MNGLQAADPSCVYNFVRTFQHRDWIDGESLVQAGKTPEEGGINERLHKIEADLDALGDNVRRAFMCVATLRAQLSICLNEIVTILNAKEKDKGKEASKDTKDTKDNTDTKDNKDTKDTKDTKDNEEAKDQKDDKDSKEDKENKDDNDKDVKERTKDGLGAAEKKDEDKRGHEVISEGLYFHPVEDNLPFVVPPRRSEQRVFITPDERPMLGERALNEPRTE